MQEHHKERGAKVRAEKLAAAKAAKQNAKEIKQQEKAADLGKTV
jgi:hypothetical protein